MAKQTQLKDREIRRKIDKVTSRAAGEWEQKTVAELGDSTGQVKSDIPGMVWVRTRNGDSFEVYNSIVPEDQGVKVWIGRRRETPTIWEVIAQRDSYAVPQAPRITYHGAQHMFRAPDEVPIDRKQITQHTIMVYDAEEFIIVVYGGPITSASGNAIIQTQLMDIASYIPSTGAVYITIESDGAGVLSVNEGVGFAGETMATPGDIPLPSEGMRRIGWVILFEGQSELLDEHIYVPMPLETNFQSTSTGNQIHEAEEETIIANDDEFGFWQAASEAIRKITWLNLVANLTAIFNLLYAPFVHSHTHFEPVTIKTEKEFHRWHIDGALSVVADAAESVLIIRTMKISLAYIHCKNNGSSGSTIVDINLNGSTIFSTSGNRPELDSTELYSVSGVPDTVDLVPGDVLTVDIDTIATGASDLTVTITEVTHELVFEGDNLVITEV